VIGFFMLFSGQILHFSCCHCFSCRSIVWLLHTFLDSFCSVSWEPNGHLLSSWGSTSYWTQWRTLKHPTM